MGILIFIGLALVIARIVQLSSTERRETSSRPAAHVTGSGEVAVPTGATIRQVSLSGDRLAIHYDTPAGAEIVVVDAGTGRTLTRLRLVPTPPSR